MKHTHYILILLIIISLTNLTAQIRYVSKTGSSTPPYTSWATASDSIQKCIEICNEGDTVIVGNGVYKETLLITKAIYLLGTSMDSTIIDGTGLNGSKPDFEGVTIWVEANTFIENFNLIGKGLLPLTTVILSDMHPLSIRSCRIKNAFGGAGVSWNILQMYNVIISNTDVPIGIYSISSEISVINNCIILASSYSRAINDWRGNTIIENNLIIKTGGSPSTGIRLQNPYYKLVKNNILLCGNSSISIDSFIRDSVLIVNNNLGYSRDEGIWQPNGNPALKILNNIIFKNNNSISANDTNKHRTNYNIFWKNVKNQTPHLVMGPNDIIADPMFVKDDTIPGYPSNFDYHLQAFSPAIDAGNPEILDPDGSRSDIGAFGGPGGEEYKYIDYPPLPPKGFAFNVISDSNLIKIKWDYNTENDFRHYRIYKDTTDFSNCDSSTFYKTMDTSLFLDSFSNETKLFYKITSEDNQGNESYPGNTINIILVGVGEPQIKIIENYLLYQNYPNPFNNETKITYSLKNRSYVKLMVYNLLGELEKVLINEEKESGMHEAILRFDNSFSSGIYLYRIEVIGENNIPVFSDMKKMIYLK